jgi:hypothetical protein
VQTSRLLRSSQLTAVVLALALTLPARAQKDKKEPEWKPATLPAEALAYGTALNGQAPPKLKAWCEEFAHKEIPKHRIDPRETMAIADKQFPKNSDEARDAAIYLVFYLAYLAEDDNQRALAHEIRQNDEQKDDILRQADILQKNDEKRIGNNRVAQTPQQMMQQQEELQKMEQQIRALDETRRKKTKDMETSRKRVDGYLKVLDVTYKRMDGVQPSVLREFQ